ncbi:MAG TPA: hypothetical protein EYG94_03190 [Campylobacterales bacterium]|nr:hypothetical protein [Campylobacterales bacterium]
MYLYAFSNHNELVLNELSNKKKLLKKRVNRADNFVNLTLLGVEQCLENISLESDTNLYISSENGNMNSTIRILDSIFRKNQLPMPFNFLNSVNASILFFVAKNFGIEGKAIFTDTFESALTQAYVDVQNGKTVLLGNVSEAIADLDLHRKKFNVDEIVEQSQWVLVSSKLEEREALAEISNLKITTSSNSQEDTINDFFSFLESNEKNYTFNSKNLSCVVTKG